MLSPPRSPDSNIAIRRVAKLSGAERADAVNMMAEAFHENPLFRWGFPELHIRGAVLRMFFAAALEDAMRFGRLEVAYKDEMVGCLIWYPPGAYPLPPLRILRGLPKYLGMLGSGPAGVFKLFRTQVMLDRLRPAAPHCHAYFLGARRCGPIGLALGRNFLREADANAWSVYLETQEPRTIALYSRLGFKTLAAEVVADIGGPKNWTMWRTPRSAEA